MSPKRFAVFQQVLRSGSLETDLRWVSEAGILGIALHWPSVAKYRMAEVTSWLSAFGLIVSSVMEDPAIDLNAKGDAWRAAAGKSFERGSQLGSPAMVASVGPLGGRSFAEADRDIRAALECLAPLAAEQRVRVLIEPVHPLLSQYSFVHTLRHALDLVGDYDGAGIVLDVAHLYWDRHFYEDLAVAMGKVVTVQVADVDPTSVGEYRYTRCQLGGGIVPLERMLLAIDGAGYRGYYEFESLERSVRSSRARYVRDARNWFEDFWAAHRQRGSESDQAAQGRPGLWPSSFDL